MPCHILVGLMLVCWYPEYKDTVTITVKECKLKTSSFIGVEGEGVSAREYRLDFDNCRRYGAPGKNNK